MKYCRIGGVTLEPVMTDSGFTVFSVGSPTLEKASCHHKRMLREALWSSPMARNVGLLPAGRASLPSVRVSHLERRTINFIIFQMTELRPSLKQPNPKSQVIFALLSYSQLFLGTLYEMTNTYCCFKLALYGVICLM